MLDSPDVRLDVRGRRGSRGDGHEIKPTVLDPAVARYTETDRVVSIRAPAHVLRLLRIQSRRDPLHDPL